MNHYTYQIENISTNKFYIGLRSSLIEPIDDIGNRYFSSSTDKEFIKAQKETPEIFKYKVLEVFEDRKTAAQHEIFLHMFYNVGTNDSFYNKVNQCSYTFGIGKTHPNYGKKRKDGGNMKGRKHSEESKEKISKAMKGREVTEETKQKMSKAQSGKIISAEQRKMITDMNNNRPILSCPHCDIESNVEMNMNRWHFDNCKHNPNYKANIIICPHCKLESTNKGNMNRWHFDNCKLINKIK